MSDKRHYKRYGPWDWDGPHGHGAPYHWGGFGAGFPEFLRGMFGRGFGFGAGFPGMAKEFFRGFEEEFEDKEDAITFLKFQKAHIKRKRKHLERAAKRMESIESEFDQVIDEVSKMDNYSPEELKKIIKQKVKEHMNKYFEEHE